MQDNLLQKKNRLFRKINEYAFMKGVLPDPQDLPKWTTEWKEFSGNGDYMRLIDTEEVDCSVYHFKGPKGFMLKGHRHWNQETITMLKGKMTMEFAMYRPITLIAGQSVTIPPKELHRAVFDEDSYVSLTYIPGFKDDEWSALPMKKVLPFLTFLLCIFLSITNPLSAQHPVVSKKNSCKVYFPGAKNWLFSSDYNMKPGDPDAGPEFINLYNAAKAQGARIVIDQCGDYFFETRLDDLDASWDIDIVAPLGATFRTKLPNMIRLHSGYDNIVDSMSYPITRGDTDVGVSMKHGNLIVIEQTKVVPDVGFAADILTEIKGQPNQELLFTAEASDSVSRAWRYYPSTFRMEGIRFESDSNFLIPQDQFIQLRGHYRTVFKGCGFVGFAGQVYDGVSIYGCNDLVLIDTYAENCRYPYLINLCSNIYSDGAEVVNCRHFTAFSTWSRDAYVKNINAYGGTRTPIESHYGWNCWYDSVTSIQTDQSNLRCFGKLKVTNSDVTSNNTTGLTTSYSLWGYHFVDFRGTEYEWIQDGTTIYFEDFEYNEVLRGKFRGLTAAAVSGYTVKNCTTTAVGCYENYTDSVLYGNVTNSLIGHVYNRVGIDSLYLKNCTFDRSLSGALYLHSSGIGQQIHFDSCFFNKYDTVFLEETWQSSGNPMVPEGRNEFTNVVDTFKNLARIANTGALARHPFIFNDCTITFQDTFVPTYAGQNTETLLILNNSTLNWTNKTLP